MPVSVKILLTSTSKKSLDLYITLLKTTFQKAKVSDSIFHLPQTLQRCTLLKSPHVHKKAKEHFELKTYSVTILCVTKNYSIIKLLIFNKPKSIHTKIFFSHNNNICQTTNTIKKIRKKITKEDKYTRSYKKIFS